MGSKSPVFLGFYSTWWPAAHLRQASIRGEKGPETRFFSFATTLAAKVSETSRWQFFVVQMCEDFSGKESLEGKWGGMKGVGFFFKYVILLEIWMCCDLGVSRFFMISVFNSKLTTHPFLWQFWGIFWIILKLRIYSSKKDYGFIGFDFQSRRFSEIPVIFRTPKDGGPVCPVTLLWHPPPVPSDVWYI